MRRTRDQQNSVGPCVGVGRPTQTATFLLGSSAEPDAGRYLERHSLRPQESFGHRLSEAVFVAKPVYRRSDCGACHADAVTGCFAPERIAIPPPGQALSDENLTDYTISILLAY